MHLSEENDFAKDLVLYNFATARGLKDDLNFHVNIRYADKPISHLWKLLVIQEFQNVGKVVNLLID